MFALSLMGFATYYMQHPIIDGQEQYLSVQFMTSGIICQNREILAQRMLQLNSTHLLFLDDDMYFPPDLVNRLLKHDVDCVGVNYRKRTRGTEFVAADLDGNVLPITQDATGLQPVLYTGFGLFLIKRKVLEAIEAPRFEHWWDERNQTYVGEDIAFFNKVRQAGFTVYVDQEASRQVEHIGDFNFRWDDELRVVDPSV